MMHGTIIGTIFYLAAFIACISGVYLLKKSENTLNGLVWVLNSFLIVICGGTIVAGLISLVHIPVNIISMAVIYLLAAGLLWYEIRKTREKQAYAWEIFDFVSAGLVILGVVCVCLKIFSIHLDYAYFNSDAGLHLKEATAIVRSQSVTNMYFTHLQNALIIELIQPFVKIVDWYKGYILGDCLFLLVETLYFLALIRRFLKTKLTKVLGLLTVLLFFMGYPFLSFYYSFGYWALGSMLVGFLVMTLRLYEKEEIKRGYAVLMLLFGCYGVMTCYMMFAPVTFLAVFFSLIVIAHREGQVFTKANVLLALEIFLLPCTLGLYYCFYGFFVSSGTSISDALSMNGGIYTELYMDFFWTLFPVFYMLVHTIRKKKLSVDIIFFGFFFLFTGGMLFLTLTHHVSTYYYYKSYYPLWMLCWVLTIQAFAKMEQESKETLAGYGLLFAMFFVLCYGKIEYKVVTSTENITGGMHSTAFFTLQQNNISFITRPHTGQDPEKMKLYEYIVENLSEEKMVPLMTETNDYGETYLYEGVSGYDFPDFYEWRHTDEELRQAYYDWDVKYALLLKNSDFFTRHPGVLREKGVSVVYETDAGYVVSFSY